MSTPVTSSVAPLRERPAWNSLQSHYEQIRGRHLRDLFASDAGRGERMIAEGAGLYLDYSKNRITDETLRLLVELAEQSGLRERHGAMFRGDRINVSEDRSVLHVALRMPPTPRWWSMASTSSTRYTRCSTGWREFSERVRSGEWEVIPERRSATWSTSASAARTSGR